MARFVKLTNDELRMWMQEIIDDVTAQLRAEAVNTICSEGTSVPRSVSIIISIEADGVPTITYEKDTFVRTTTETPSKRFANETV